MFGVKKKQATAAAEIRKITGKILENGPDISDEHRCAVGLGKRITVPTMKALLLLESKGLFFKRNTHSVSNADVRKRTEQYEGTKFFFGLPTSSVSRLAPEKSMQKTLKRNEVRVSKLKPGDIVAVPLVPSEDLDVIVLYLGKIVEAGKMLSASILSIMTKDTAFGGLLKANDLHTGSLLKKKTTVRNLRNSEF